MACGRLQHIWMLVVHLHQHCGNLSIARSGSQTNAVLCSSRQSIDPVSDSRLRQLLRHAIGSSRRQLDNVLQSPWDTIVHEVIYRPGEATSAAGDDPYAHFRERVRRALMCVHLSESQQVRVLAVRVECSCLRVVCAPA